MNLASLAPRPRATRHEPEEHPTVALIAAWQAGVAKERARLNARGAVDLKHPLSREVLAYLCSDARLGRAALEYELTERAVLSIVQAAGLQVSRPKVRTRGGLGKPRVSKDEALAALAQLADEGLGDLAQREVEEQEVARRDGKLTTTEVARELGVSTRTVRDWKRSGCPGEVVKGRGPTGYIAVFDLQEVIAWRAERDAEKPAKRSAKEHEPSVKPNPERPEVDDADEELLTGREAAEAMGVGPEAIRQWRLKGMPFERHGKGYRYRLAEVQEWRAAHEEETGKPFVRPKLQEHVKPAEVLHRDAKPENVPTLETAQRDHKPENVLLEREQAAAAAREAVSQARRAVGLSLRAFGSLLTRAGARLGA